MRRVSAGIREEEVCQILNLKKNLDYSDVLTKYAAKYLRIGWDLVAVNFKGEPALDLDFKQSQKFWADKLTSLGMDGIQVNLGVRTGAPSRLLVLEVHREESLPPFSRRGEWCSGCVAEAGLEREQHYYALPKGWQPPASFFLEAFQVMVFGEGGLVLAPPSLEPRAQSNLRWLRPPWESPPTRPSPGLCRFIKEHAPVLPQTPAMTEAAVTPWVEIYPSISPHPEVLQALLAPAASSQKYYQNLLQAAKTVGLEDPQVLLALLWHAPLGNSHHHSQKEDYLMDLVKRALVGVEGGQLWEEEVAPGDDEAMARLEAGCGMVHPTDPAYPAGGVMSSPTVPHMTRGESPCASGMPVENLGPAPGQPTNGRAISPPGWDGLHEAWNQMWRFSHENLIVERRRYEAMIYELGKLGALQDIFKREHRQNKALRDRLESQWTKELDYLRQLVAKNTKKGWYRSWRQE